MAFIAKVFPKIIKIGQKHIGEGNPALIVADIGANFDGNLKKAKRLAYTAKESGADVVKFQTFKAKTIVSAIGFKSMKLKGVHGSWGKSVDQVFREAEFPLDWHKQLNDYCKEIGIIFSSTPYNFESVDLLIKLDVPFIKIGSGDITWHEMLKYIAKKNKPMILSTGASTLSEVDEAVRVIESTGNTRLCLLQCITNYPSKIKNANINVINTYKTVYSIITGYSDHSPGDVVVLGSIALGAKVIEKHFTLNKLDKGPDHPHSMEPHEFKLMVQRIRDLESGLGSYRKDVVEEESETVIVQRRSLYANRTLLKGKVIKKKDIIELRPALGILPKYKELLIDKKVKKTIKKGYPFKWEDLL